MNLEIFFPSLKRSEQKIFDPIRKKWLVETKEEIVRQLMICYLTQDLQYGKGRIAVEKKIRCGKTFKRFDIVIYDKKLHPYILVECKSYALELKENVAFQISRYNISLKAPYLCVTNGIDMHCAFVDFNDLTITLLPKLPVNQE